MSAERMVPAMDLMVGDRVRDNFTAWAEVVTIDDTPAGIKIEWVLADGRGEVMTYDPDNMFTLIDTDMPNPTCEGMGNPAD